MTLAQFVHWLCILLSALHGAEPGTTTTHHQPRHHHAATTNTQQAERPIDSTTTTVQDEGVHHPAVTIPEYVPGAEPSTIPGPTLTICVDSAGDMTENC